MTTIIQTTCIIMGPGIDSVLAAPTVVFDTNIL